MRMSNSFVACVTAALVLGASSSVAAQATRDPLDFTANYARYTLWEGIATGVAAAVTVGFIFVPPRSRTQSTNGVDEGVRDAFRLSSPDSRGIAATVSDLLVAGLWAYEAIVDPLVVAWGVHGKPGTAAQVFLINTEVQLVTSALQGITTAIVGRERPLVRDCDDPVQSIGADSAQCAGNDRNRSFFSGHTSQAFAAASAQCMHHLNLPLYGGVSAAVPCAAGYTVAALVGGLRMMADRHYFSDVLMGASVGTLVGLLVPWLFHYREGVRPPADAAGVTTPITQQFVVPNGLGVTYLVIF